MRFFAPAKLNLSLDLGPLRQDGYHEIRTTLQAVSFGDRLFLTPAERFAVVNPAVPQGDLVRRAGELFARAAGVAVRAEVRVVKRIPIGAGLGGGSSDAACALRALRALLRPDMPEKELSALGAEIGSDVPFFLGPSPRALAEGRGEVLTPLAPRAVRFVVIAWPGEALSTADVYRESAAGRGEATKEVLSGAELAGNDLAAAAARLSPALAEMLRAAAAKGLHLQVTGSGSAAFSLHADLKDAVHALRAARATASRAVLCTTLGEWPWQVNRHTGNE